MEWPKVTDLLRWKGSGIRRRLLRTGLIFLAAALLSNTLAGSFYTRALIKKNAAELQAEIASRIAQEIAEFIQRKIERLADLSTALSNYELGSDRQKLLALLLLKNDRSFTELSILDSKGMEVLKVSERKVYLLSDFSDQSQSEKFKKAIGGETYVSAVYTSNRAEPYVTVAVPIKASSKQNVGVVSVEADIRFLWQVIGDVEFGKAGYAYLIDHEGKLIAHRDPSQVLRERFLGDLAPVKRFLQNPLPFDPNPGEEVQGLNGASVVATYASVPKLGWAVVVEEPVAVALADIKRMLGYASGLLVTGLLVGAALIVWVSDRITKPIRELSRGADIIGGGSLDHRVEVKTGDEIEQLAEGFNKMAGELKISYTTLEQKVERRTKELAALYAVAKTVSQSLNVDEILYDFTNKVKDLLGTQKVGVFSVDWEKKQLVLRAQRGMRQERLSFVGTTPLEETFIGQTTSRGAASYVEDLWTDPRVPSAIRENLTHQGARSVAIVPLKFKGKVLGALSVGHNEANKFTSEELNLVGSFADQLAVAIENINLFEEVRQKSRELQVLVKINRDVAALLDRETLLPRIADEARRLLNVDSTTFRLLEGDDFVRTAYAGDQDILALPAHIKARGGMTDKLIQGKQVVVVRNLKEDPTMSEGHREILAKLGYCSFLAVPLVVGDRVSGTLHLYSKWEREFKQEEIDLLTGFADQAAIAIYNANLFAEIRKKSAELEVLNLELGEANRAKADFLAAMSHELRTPLNVIIGNADLFKDGFFGDVNGKQRDALEKILRYSQVLLKLINDVLMLTRMEAKKMSLDLSTFTLADVIGHVETFVDQLHLDGRLEVVWNVQPHLRPMFTDAMKLEEILQNLIGNAVKFTSKGKVEVRVRDLPGREQIEFAVTDTGIGIEPSDLEKIFDPFHQLKEAHTGSFSGAGLGLNIVKNYLELMGGNIRVESELGKGSTFTFTLPYFLHPEKQVPETTNA